jgi:dimethylamine monooxygenase subunit A
VRNHLTAESWGLSSIDPLELCGRLVQEDLCLIQDSADGPVLTAAALCFPSRWRLSDKIGKPLRQVHGPVPLYADRLAGAVDRFMRNLKPNRIVSRFAWSLLDDPALFQPDGRSPTAGRTITDEDAGERIFLRVERQTLRRLPVSAAVVFGIRVHVYPLSRVIDNADRAAALAAAVQALPVEVQHYKNLSPFSRPLLGGLGKQVRDQVTPLS